MPLRETPSFKAVQDKVLSIADVGIGGLNLKDLEYEQEINQSPYMLNMMYRNGAFSKRFGQEYYETYSDQIYSLTVFKSDLIVHAGSKIYKNGTELTTGIAEKEGLFVQFNQQLVYICSKIYTYDGTTWKTIEPYVPIITINRRPDGSQGNTSEAYNMLGRGFQNNFHGDGTSVDFYLTDKNLDSDTPKAKVDNVEWTYDANLSAAKTFKIDRTTGKVTFKSAPPAGTNNVEIIAYKHDDEWTDYNDQILNSKYYACFGGNNNSRLFLAGGGKSIYYYSEVYDVSYFPYTNYARVGNSAEDITGFGQQYNVLMIFKPTEIYSLTYYQQSSSTTTDESQYGLGAFSSQVVNNMIGCDCPKSIQLINNQLTWLSTREGVCCLVSTNIIDERNVRPISRNINRANNFGIQGILDWTDRENVVSADWDNKYFLANPSTGQCFMWDYAISSYYVGTSRSADPKDLDWYLFDNFYVKDFLKIGNDLIYSKSNENTKLVKLNYAFDDFGNAIRSYYMTPFLQFDAVEYLKNIKNIYVQCRGDTSSVIDMYYYTEESVTPEAEPESIRIGGKLWAHFQWNNFQWLMVNWANTFRRKCNLKKIQMASFYFVNNEVDRDMSITHIGLQYQLVKFIR